MEIVKVALEKKIFNFVILVFLLFFITSPSKKGMTLYLNKLESHSHRLFCAKFGGNWPSGSGEDENVKSLHKDV